MRRMRDEVGSWRRCRESRSEDGALSARGTMMRIGYDFMGGLRR